MTERLLRVLCVGLVVTWWATSAVAEAGSGGGRVGGRVGSVHRQAGGFPSHGFPSHGSSFQHRGFGHHHLNSRPFLGTVIVSPPLVVYSPPPAFYYGAPSYYADAPYYSPPVGMPSGVVVPSAPPPPPAPLSHVVVYPTGRYELRGDGESQPYRWVWVPNPPAAAPDQPPLAPPPSLAPPPAPPSTPDPPTSGRVPPTRLSRLYHWIDDQGVGHWTDRLEVVPPRYREEADRAEGRRPGLDL